MSDQLFDGPAKLKHLSFQFKTESSTELADANMQREKRTLWYGKFHHAWSMANCLYSN